MSLFRKFTACVLCLLLSRHVNAQFGADTQIPLQSSLVTAADNSTGCHQTCILLQGVLGQAVYHNVLPADFQNQYFSVQQRELVPVCVVQPESTDQVSQVINVLNQQECPFAIKSGGHGFQAGTSNIHNGLVIDLSKLNGIELSDSGSTAAIGTASRWGDVYLKLQEHGLLTVGGRVASVGVGGFTLGGGISFLSRRHGWALDNVRNFEVVLANGTIANANQHSHPDLFFALRGGGNNFGIVTRFDFETYQYGLLWGGTSVCIFKDIEDMRTSLGLLDKFQWSLNYVAIQSVRLLQRAAVRLGFGTKSADLIAFFVNLASEEQKDPHAHAYIFFSWLPVQRAYLSGTTILYSRPEVNPPVFQDLASLKPIYNTNRLANMSDFAEEVENMNFIGFRQYWDVATFKVDATLISKIWDIFLSETDPLRTMPGAISSNLQLLTKDEIAIFAKHGGNALGVEKDDGPLFFFGITIAYNDASDDELYKSTCRNIISRAIELGKEMGLYHPFIYQNYAATGRDVFAGYGAKNHDRLLQIQQKYDPNGVFSRLQPGYFKL